VRVQRKHAFRCYEDALQIYTGKGWNHVSDHVQFILAKQAFHLNLLDIAVEYFVSILRDSQQSSQQQADYLREFLYIYKVRVNNADFVFVFFPEIIINFFSSSS